MEEFIDCIRQHLSQQSFIKLTLSKPTGKTVGLMNIYGKMVKIKGEPKLSLTYHYATQDIIKNLAFDEGATVIKETLGKEFQIATLRTTQEDVVLRVTRRGKVETSRLKASNSSAPDMHHDNAKYKRADPADDYLFHLGITDTNGKVIPKMADKFRQINKYLEVMEGLLDNTEISEPLRIVDMGAGKGYLTFALYNFLKSKSGKEVSMTGVEVRKTLVDKANSVAVKCGFEKLHFVCHSIAEFDSSCFNILIALHACDTATDDALAKGIGAGANLIVCAPCCHKQIRQQLKGKEHSNPLLKYGIFKEREFEMVTDTIRALILEKNNYKSNIFEFISNEHTRKNTMLVGVKTKNLFDKVEIGKRIESLKNDYQIEYHYLEKLI